MDELTVLAATLWTVLFGGVATYVRLCAPWTAVPARKTAAGASASRPHMTWSAGCCYARWCDARPAAAHDACKRGTTGTVARAASACSRRPRSSSACTMQDWPLPPRTHRDRTAGHQRDVANARPAPRRRHVMDEMDEMEAYYAGLLASKDARIRELEDTLRDFDCTCLPHALPGDGMCQRCMVLKGVTPTDGDET